MYFANPSGLILLLFVAAVAGMHVLRRRLPVRRVAAVFLWGTPAKARSPGAIRRADLSFRPGSLVCDVAVVVLLAVVASEPTFDDAGGPGSDPWSSVLLRLALGAAALAILVLAWRAKDASGPDSVNRDAS